MLPQSIAAPARCASPAPFEPWNVLLLPARSTSTVRALGEVESGGRRHPRTTLRRRLLMTKNGSGVAHTFKGHKGPVRWASFAPDNTMSLS